VRTKFEDGTYVASSKIELFRLDFDSIYQGVRDFNIAFFLHPYIAVLASEMTVPSPKRILRATSVSLGIAGAMSYLIPFIAYLIFLDGEPESAFFLYLDPSGCPEVIVGTISVLVIAVISNIYFSFMAINATVEFFHPGSPENPKLHMPRFVCACALSLVAIAITRATDIIWILIEEMSSIAYTVLGFFLPALFFLIRYKFSFVKEGISALIVLALGSALTVLGIMEAVGEAKDL
jgi:hypothetical protein